MAPQMSKTAAAAAVVAGTAFVSLAPAQRSTPTSSMRGSRTPAGHQANGSMLTTVGRFGRRWETMGILLQIFQVPHVLLMEATWLSIWDVVSIETLFSRIMYVKTGVGINPLTI